MADSKISIDININAEGKQQLDQYKGAFDGLRTSITNLSNPISKLDSDVVKLNDTLNNTGKESNTVSGIIDKLSNAFNTAKDAIGLVKDAFGTLKKEAALLEGELTLGLSVIIAFGPQLIDWAKSLLKGGEAADKAKLSISAMSAALQNGAYADATKQINELKINVGLARQGFLNKQEVLQQYNTTVGKTLGQVSTLKELEDKLVKSGPKYIEMTMLKAAAQEALQKSAKKASESEELKLKKDEDSATTWDKISSGFKSLGMGFLNYNSIVKEAGAKRKAQLIKDADDTSKGLLDAAKNFQKQAADIAKTEHADLLGGEFLGSNENKSPKKPAKTTGSDSANIKEEATQKLQETADAFNKQLEQQHKNYATEQADLKDQLDKKLITQEEYFASWEKLQDKYHVGIGESIKLFNERDLAQAQQHQRELVETEKLSNDQDNIDKAKTPDDKLAAEKQLINDRYTFEIQRAADAGNSTVEIRKKAQQELSALDKKYADEQKAVDKKNEDEQKERDKQKAQERKNFEVEQAQQVSNAAFSILQNNIKSQSDTRIKQLEAQKNAELSNTSLTASQKKAIEDKYQKKEAEEKVKAFKSEQKASILQAVINGALAITKATAQTGILGAFVIPGIIAATAIQVATIAAQKPPQYAKGGLHYQSDGRGALLSGYSRTDNTNAYLRSGEAVVVSEAMRNPWARNLVSAINVAYGGRDFSITNPGRGYAIGGIFTDGGNSNRYYNQPVNDQKDLANTIAYQMINNFPPVYVDVKDINNQQNILAQTINRVNL